MPTKDAVNNIRIYVLISSNIASLPVKETAELVVRGGADAIQLREKTMSDCEFISLGWQIRELTNKSDTLLIINDRINVAKELDADGVHLGQHDSSIGLAKESLGTDKIVGASTHNISQAIQAQRDGADYIATGPIYPTETKAMELPVGTGLIREAIKVINIPIIAIGAINLSNLDQVLRAGASRIAVCSAIISTNDIFNSTREFKQKLTSLNR
ncbi:MAG: thiamine phosphate synthase [Planctomycetes bacterium]|nr:thiamine phosphate synthase [Planctomycetota bacterium]